MGTSPGMLGRTILFLAVLCGAGVRATDHTMTAWVSPTAGCSGSPGDSCYPTCSSPAGSRCDVATVCQPTYLQTMMGESLRFNMTAMNPSSMPGAPYLLQVQKMPNDAAAPCCGFTNYFAYDWLSAQNPEMLFSPIEGGSGRVFVRSPFPATNNMTQVEFEFDSTSQHLTGTPPPLFNITFESQYAYYPENPTSSWTNVTSCPKVMFVRLCSRPSWASTATFTDEPLVGGAYKPPNTAYVGDPECGLAKHAPCLVGPGRMVGDTVMVNMSLSAAMGAMHGVRVGQELHLTISSKTLDVGSSLEIMVMSDPGLPIGMTAGADYACGERTMCKDLSWTPRKGQEGVMHQAHLQAVSTSHLDPSVNPCKPAASNHLAVGFPVLRPQSMWTDGLDATFAVTLNPKP